ncbi:MAG: 4Fe-4S dicluster domain-containing protein [Candidatus Cloacimonadota bacterium]|nr:MAG: 4Fe-4S dicluster domain-containing protein [Candidatus Cloacimonadota bacterium]
MVNLKIDGQKIEVEEGTTILKAASELSIEIPTLCYHPALEPYQACRVCVVEMVQNGRSKLVASCGRVVEEGMVVKTDSERAKRARRLFVELLLARAPASELLQDLARKVGIEVSRFKTKKEDEKCILCGLCVRVCNDVMKIGAIGFANRGAKIEVTPPFKEFSKVCTTCGACAFVCPTGAIKLEEITENKVTPLLSEFDEGLEKRPCIYIPFPQAVPNKPVIDRENCMYFKTGNCKICETVCQPKAILYDQEDTIIEEDIGAIVVATGYDLMDISQIGEYGGGRFKDVIDALTFERYLAPAGPTSGKVIRPSDGKVPREVAFVSCAGSRDPEHGVAYCSRLCCMYLIKQAMLYKHAVHDGQAYIFYIDIRSNGKGYEEFVQRAKEEDNVIYIRGKVSKIAEDNGKLRLWGVDTLTGEQIELNADMVVTANAMLPSTGVKELASKLRIPTDSHGWLQEAHLKLRPMETLTNGIFIAGAAQSPKDITDSVAQASGAAAKVLALFSQDYILGNPVIAYVDEEICAGCGTCETICEYTAVEVDPLRNVAVVNEALCEGCGACAGACPSGAMQHKNFTKKQLFDMVEIATEKY